MTLSKNGGRGVKFSFLLTFALGYVFGVGDLCHGLQGLQGLYLGAVAVEHVVAGLCLLLAVVRLVLFS